MNITTYPARALKFLDSFANSRRTVLRQHVWSALAILAITLAFFQGIDYGNSLGADDWMHLYRTCEIRSPEFIERPFALLSLYMVCPIFKADLSLYHFVLIGFRVASAFLLYLLVWQISRQALFAFACGAVFSTFLVRDGFFVFTYLQQNDHVFSQMLVLLTLNVFIHCLRSQNTGRFKVIWLLVSLLLLIVTSLVREATIPLLLTIPLLVSLFDRDFSKSRLLSLGLWVAVIVGWVIRYAIVMRGGASYSGGTFLDLDLTRMLLASKDQLDFAFRRVFQLSPDDIYQFRASIFIVIGTLVFCFLLILRSLYSHQTEPSILRRSIYYLVWVLGGVLAAWLGFAAFLPTIYASSPIRTHILATAGESVALAGVIWLISYITSYAGWRIAVQVIGLAVVGAHGAVMANIAQQDMYSFVGTWENPAYFFRSLANTIPAVKGQTLLIYIENPATEETPFIGGWNLQFGLRYFYEDQVTGIIPTDNILGEWSISDSGIRVQELWIDPPHTFGWNEIIFITRETSGRIYILDKLPERFLTAYRQSLYRPFDQITPAFIPQRIRESFPIISGPDWTGENYLLQNQ